MRMHTVTISGLALAALLLTGCAPSTPIETATPSPTATPLFASDEGALAAAEEAYAAYQRAVDISLATGSASGLAAVAKNPALQAGIDSVSSFAEQGKKLVGESKIDSVSLAQITSREAQQFELQLYGCLDISSTDVLDSAGVSTVPASRDVRLPMLVSLQWAAPSSRFLVLSAEVWDGNDFC